MASPSRSLLLLHLLLHLLLTGLLSASNVYIVYMGEKVRYEPETAEELHYGILSSALGSERAASSSILYNYKHGLSGFAALMTESEATQIANLPGVVNVVPNRILDLHTTRNWDFLHLNPNPPNGILSMSRSGDGSIVGVLDTGIWPEFESFSDHGMGQIPSRWRGICQGGEIYNVIY